jgi:hypothetical protein
MSGRPHPVGWSLAGLVLLGLTLIWVQARRRTLSVRLTPYTLTLGRESLQVSRIAEVDAVGTPIGVKVLGGWDVPRKYEGVPLKLEDGSVVLAWARHGRRLRAALLKLIAT